MSASVAASGAVVLIVDDDEAARYVKARVLRAASYEVIESGSGSEALRLVAERRPSIVLLDVNLPDLSGWDVCRMLKDDPATSSMPVLQMSASYVTEADTVRALEGGADACLTEPVEPPVLIATVRALLRARRAEESLRQALSSERTARAAAEAASRTKDEFLATLSHELRSPLNAILTWATLARSRRLPADRLEHALTVIERNTRLQVRMIDELLDVSRIVAGKMQLDVRAIDLAAIAQAAVDGVQLLAEEKDVRLTAGLPAGGAHVAGDPSRLQQVLGNLLSNAVKFTPRGGAVELAVQDRGDVVLVTVTDTGRGIPAEHLPRIFERFRQVDASTTRSEGGLGLGLAIVRHLVELHGGTVAAQSAGEGRGAIFSVRLPRLETGHPSAAAARAPSAAASPDEPSDLRGVSILLVDDVDDARDAVAMLLSQAGARVTQAASARDAWASLQREVPTVVVSDLAMPHEDGFSLLRRIRASDDARIARAPVIALTAYNAESDRRSVEEAGFDEHVAKPTDGRELARTIARLVRRDR